MSGGCKTYQSGQAAELEQVPGTLTTPCVTLRRPGASGGQQRSGKRGHLATGKEEFQYFNSKYGPTRENRLEDQLCLQATEKSST